MFRFAQHDSAIYERDSDPVSTNTTTKSRVCAKCGATIFADSPRGFCSVCLFKTGLGSLEDERDGEQKPSRIQMEFGDYELLEEIGRGGQGVVYRARQKSLNRTVALKVIGLGQWSSMPHLKRFRHEAEAAARLEHAQIVPIYEIAERDGSCYFSMQFIEGGQLDQVLKREPMSPRRATELLVKIARTVHFAHEHGILHRDIKPGNILVDKNGEPHLTDFGLARLIEQQSTVTNSFDVLGTPSYMPPEQAAGHTKELTAAADVYSLGAVFYQMLTGEPPFAGGTTYETIRMVLESEPRNPRTRNPKVNVDLATICLKCLEKDPARRYQSAAALGDDIERWLKHEPIQARRTGMFDRGRKWLRRNPTTALVAALLAGLIAAVAVIVSKSDLFRRIPSSGVAVLPFENLSGNPDNAYFVDGIQEEILTRLASIADLKVISRMSTQHYQNKPRNLREIAKQLGVANIVEGSVQKVADEVRVNVQLINAQTDSHLWADTYDRKLTDIFGVESEIAKRIADSLQAKLGRSEEQALAVKPTNNPEAYDLYLRGRAFEARSSFSIDAERKATGFFERAVQLDPNFAIAWARLSRADAYVYFESDDTTAARRDAAKAALENAQKLEPNSPETLLALGYYQYWVLVDYGAAKTTFERVGKMLPNSSEVPSALGRVARRAGRWDESIDYVEQALALDPRNVELLFGVAWTYAQLRQSAAALKLYDRILDITPNDPAVMAFKAAIFQAQGNLQDAAGLLSGINEQVPSEDAFVVKITQLRLERNFAEAVRLLQAREAQFHFASSYYKSVDQVILAFTQRLAGDATGAKVTASQARNALEQLYRDQPGSAFIPANLSQVSAVMGEKDSALAEAERAIILLPRAKDRVAGPYLEESLAFVQTMVGENSRAISTLTQLLQTAYYGWFYRTPITPALLRLDPIWDPLRADPAFQKLCEEKQP
jgi:TolB-like protein/Tfp pilus assembly protein PilF/predicted Ser/Thr protein kinase